MILSYGLHWRIDKVYWGRQTSLGGLIGAASKSKEARAVDFREQRGLYALHAEYDLVYVGQTGGQGQRLFKRLKDHISDRLAERWDRFSWFGNQWVTQQGYLSVDTVRISQEVGAALNVLEAVTTAVAEPRLNLQRGRWGDATQYYQLIAEGSDEDRVRRSFTEIEGGEDDEE